MAADRCTDPQGHLWTIEQAPPGPAAPSRVGPCANCGRRQGPEDILRPARATKIETTLDQVEALHGALAHSRSSAETVRVPKAALAALLRDHASMAFQLNVRD